MSNPNVAGTPASQIHRVTLDYVEQGEPAQAESVGGVKVDPELVRVRKGDTLRFIKGRGPDGANVRISFSDSSPFSSPKAEGNDLVVNVTSDLKRRISYGCELVRNGKVVASSEVRSAAANGGGHVEPASGERGAL